MVVPIRSCSPLAGGAGAPARPVTDPIGVLAHLTDRDRWLLTLLAEHQVLTTPQIAELAFSRLDLAQRRLLKLIRLGVLDRFRWHTLVGSQAWHYALGPVGSQLVAAMGGAQAPRPGEHRARLTRLAASPRLAHLGGVNGIFTSLAGYAREHPPATLGAWWSERRCTERYGELVRPDGYGRWTEGGRTVAFFLEYDTGSEPLTRLTAKLPGYADLATAGGPAIPVLVWLPSARREANLRTALAAHPTPVRVATTNAELARAVGQGPAGAVWLAGAGPHRRSLAELGSLATADYDRAAVGQTGRSVAEVW